MALEQPQPKKVKHSIISDHVYSLEFQEFFSKHWHANHEIRTETIEIIAKPFRVCRILNFLKSEEFMDEIKNELLDVKSRRNSIDLYQFEQTSDLVAVDSENLKQLYETFQSDLTTWMEKNTNIPLNKKISMSSSCYSDTDYLLCHDDNMGDRRIAYILYLSKNWTAEDGGALDLFDTDDNGLPRNVVKSILPEYNSLVFFEVLDNSYHQVAEITSGEKSRWSINGWLHGSLRESTKPPRPEIEPIYIEPIKKELDLKDWVTECYLYPKIVKVIQQDIEQESFAFLSYFLKSDVYENLLTDLTSDTITWTKVGPADIRNYEIADESSLSSLLKEFCDLFKTMTLFELLKGYTELDLVPEKENMHPKMTIELQRWSNGCYTLICDKSVSTDTAAVTGEKTIESNNIYEHHIDDKEGRASGTSNSANLNESVEYPTISNTEAIVQSDRDTPPSSKDDDEIDEDETFKKMIGKGKSPRSKKKKNFCQVSSSFKIENASPQKSMRNLDTDDSDVSDIGDYLSDPLDCSLECSDQDEDVEEPNVSEPGSLDVIIQFNTSQVPEDISIDYVDPSEKEGALIHIPLKDNHLCLVYKTQGTCRLQKYVNHYCKEYFYNLICTYYE